MAAWNNSQREISAVSQRRIFHTHLATCITLYYNDLNSINYHSIIDHYFLVVIFTELYWKDTTQLCTHNVAILTMGTSSDTLTCSIVSLSFDYDIDITETRWYLSFHSMTTNSSVYAILIDNLIKMARQPSSNTKQPEQICVWLIGLRITNFTQRPYVIWSAF